MNIFKYKFLLSFLFVALFTFSFVFASSPFDITFPVAQLGGCVDQNECRTYCDDFAHKNECIDFALAHGFATDDEVEKVKNMPSVGPGGCTSELQCRSYCENPDNREECFVFGQEHKIIKGEEVSRRARLIRESDAPGKCQSERECRAYCENPANHQECFVFAEEHGLIDEKDADFIEEILANGGPGGCRSENQCRAYCENPDNFDICISFAEEHGLMDTQEVQRIRRMPPIGPGGCRGRECETYCENPDNFNVCISFAEEHGLIDNTQSQRAKALGNMPGPGGCRGVECRDYCENPDHQEECFVFASERGLIDEEEVEHVRKFMDSAREGGPGGCRGAECRTYCENPDNQEECFAFAKEHDLINEKEIAMIERGQGLSDRVREIGGPGGCRSDSECQQYCKDQGHGEECLAFAVEHGNFSVEEARNMFLEFTEQENIHLLNIQRADISRSRFDSLNDFSDDRFEKFEHFKELEDQFRDVPQAVLQGPGGCHGPEECIRYCSDPLHRDECGRFNPSEEQLPPGDIFKNIESGNTGNFSDDYNTQPFNSDIPSRVPIEEIQAPRDLESFSEHEREGILCTQQYEPVCGANKRTYPNECFAKRDNMQIVKRGPCERLEHLLESNGALRQPYSVEDIVVSPPPARIQPEQFIPSDGIHKESIAPQSRSLPDLFFANLLGGLSGAIRGLYR